jgi:predicted  nucleic acid-binding Zn-ribbon protein
MDKLRIESDANLSRAAKAEESLKELGNELSAKDTEINGLKNKINLLENDVARMEKRIEEVRVWIARNRLRIAAEHEVPVNSSLDMLRRARDLLLGLVFAGALLSWSFGNSWAIGEDDRWKM